MKNTHYPYDKRIYTDKLHEPLQSFRAFNIWLQHPNWTLKKLSEETNIKYDKIKTWSRKYKYFQRRADKEADEWKFINHVALESKINAIKMASARNLKLQTALNARTEVTTTKNVELLKRQHDGILTDDLIERTDKHTYNTFRIENEALNTNKSIEDLVNTIEFETTKTNNEFAKLNEILQQSRKNNKNNEELKEDDN